MFQEEAALLKFVCISNDGVDEHMVWYVFSLPKFSAACNSFSVTVLQCFSCF